jgi:hypothetical protein
VDAKDNARLSPAWPVRSMPGFKRKANLPKYYNC